MVSWDEITRTKTWLYILVGLWNDASKESMFVIPHSGRERSYYNPNHQYAIWRKFRYVLEYNMHQQIRIVVCVEHVPVLINYMWVVEPQPRDASSVKKKLKHFSCTFFFFFVFWPKLSRDMNFIYGILSSNQWSSNKNWPFIIFYIIRWQKDTSEKIILN